MNKEQDNKTRGQIANVTVENYSAPPGIIAIPAAILGVVFVGIILHFISDAILTFVAALFLANIFLPIVEKMRKKKIPSFFAVVLVLSVVGVVLLGIVAILSSTVSSISEVMPKYQLKWDHVFLPWIIDVGSRISPEFRKHASDFSFTSIVPPEKIVSVLSTIPALISSFTLILLFMLFIVASHGQFRKKIDQAFPPSGSFHLKQMVENIESRVRTYLLTSLLINTAAGVTMTVVLLAFGVDLALLWGVITFLLMFIPSIGSIFAISLPILASFVQFDSVTTPIILGVIIIVSQLLIGSFIAPRVLGNSLNLSPLLILITIIFWGWVWGPLGMILAVPITSAITIVFENIPPLRPLAVMMSSGGQTRIKKKSR